jgi:hypothetical protein
MPIELLTLTPESGVSVALQLFPQGTRLDVLSDKHTVGKATNRVMTVEKTASDYADWRIIERTKSADPSVLPPTYGDADAVLSPRDLAAAIMTGDFWAAKP